MQVTLLASTVVLEIVAASPQSALPLLSNTNLLERTLQLLWDGSRDEILLVAACILLKFAQSSDAARLNLLGYDALVIIIRLTIYSQAQDSTGNATPNYYHLRL